MPGPMARCTTAAGEPMPPEISAAFETATRFAEPFWWIVSNPWFWLVALLAAWHDLDISRTHRRIEHKRWLKNYRRNRRR